MPTHSFFFCSHCNEMFLNQANKRCPGCNCEYSQYRPEKWELDPFDPQSWPFTKPKIKKAFDEKSTNEQYCIETEISSKQRLATSALLILFSLLCIIPPYSTFNKSGEYSQHFRLICGFFATLAIFLIFLAILTLQTDCISIDNNNVYLKRSCAFFRKKHLHIDRKSCKVKMTHSSLTHSSSYRVCLTYPCNGETKELIIGYPNEDSLRITIDNMRWYSMYIKYAYNEDLLPDPTPKLGHEDLALEPNTESESQVEQLK